MKLHRITVFTAIGCSLLAGAAIAQNVISLPSVPANVVRGHIPADRAPVLKIQSGQTVAIDTISHQGISTPEGAVAFFGKGGVRPEDVLPDAIAVQKEIAIPQGGGTHVLTGPIHIEGAEPGDLLEVRVINVELRVPYGVNASNKGTGVLPALLDGPMFRIIHLDAKRNVALFAPGIEVPLAPFMGIMAVAPPPGGSMTSSRPPGMFGGNLDLKQLTRGASLYLPVYNTGALFYTGDAHTAQGDGEVDGTAIETSLKPTLQFIGQGQGHGRPARRNRHALDRHRPRQRPQPRAEERRAGLGGLSDAGERPRCRRCLCAVEHCGGFPYCRGGESGAERLRDDSEGDLQGKERVLVQAVIFRCREMALRREHI